MKAEILAVGTELLLGDILNTNAQFLAQELANLGIEVYYQTVVGDNPQRLKDTIFHAFSRADLIITTGGLGPTEDDLTKETAAEYFGERLIPDERALGRIRKYFDRTGRVMTENNVKQAMVPEKNGIVLYNDNGTAPGIIMEKNGKMIVMLPGPPRETIPMFQNQVKPYLAKKQEFTFVSRILRVAEVGESAMEERVKDIIDAQTNPTIAPYAKDGEAILRITAKARDEEEANRLIDPVAAVLKERLGDAVYGEGETDLETVVAEQQLTLAVAESCTGGMIASNLVEYPGISAALVEGCVTYSNEAKMHRLGVKAETLEKYGAVSEETAKEMAEGIARTSGADIGVATTGVAGPESSEGKPVDASCRTNAGFAASLICIGLNITLCLAKGIAGLLAGSVSLIADAFNNLSDASSNIVSLLGFRLASRPADEGHPYGHGRYEYLAGLFVAVLVCAVGINLILESVTKIIKPSPTAYTFISLAALATSMLVKLWMAAFNRTLGNRIDSETLIATAQDSKNDVITSGSVLVAALISQTTGFDLDGWASARRHQPVAGASARPQARPGNPR